MQDHAPVDLLEDVVRKVKPTAIVGQYTCIIIVNATKFVCYFFGAVAYYRAEPTVRLWGGGGGAPPFWEGGGVFVFFVGACILGAPKDVS